MMKKKEAEVSVTSISMATCIKKEEEEEKK
jgi:hypothetical protein